jgi:hypothetical protein
MEPEPHTPATTQPEKPKPSRAKPQANTHDTRESWLRAAMVMIAPIFDQAGHPLPDTRRAAIGFTSRGGKGNCVGECWHSSASADAHFEIFIRPDKADPIEVLGILAHELVHAAVPVGSGHGPIYKELALKIGLEGKMRHALPGMHLAEKLEAMAADLGPFPHASIDLTWRESAPRKKQKTNMLKAACPGGPNADGEPESCDYVVRLTKLHAEKGPPLCGVHKVEMRIEWPESEDEDAEPVPEGDADAGEPEGFKASDNAATPNLPEGATNSFKASGDPDDEQLADLLPRPIAPRRPFRQPDPEPSPGFRWAADNEVHPAGHVHRINLETGRAEVSLEPIGGADGQT